MHWKRRLFEKVEHIAARFVDDQRILGVALGGSVGRGMVWKHSDLELCLLVEETIPELQHFNVIDGMGVEIFQFTISTVESFLAHFTEPNESILKIPIQIYRCRIVDDPTGLFGRFKETFDASLFHDNIITLKVNQACQLADARLEIAKDLLEQGCPRTALAQLRIGTNQLILATYWFHRMLPRSQSRTEYLLKRNISTFGQKDLYNAFIAIYKLDQPHGVMKANFLNAKNEFYTLANEWGSETPRFLQTAVDGNLEWGVDKSIMYVYKYCAHRMQCSDDASNAVYDSKDYKGQFGQLYRFLDLERISEQEVAGMIALYENARAKCDPSLI